MWSVCIREAAGNGYAVQVAVYASEHALGDCAAFSPCKMVEHRLGSDGIELENDSCITKTSDLRRSIKISCSVPRQQPGGRYAICRRASKDVQVQEIVV